MSEQSNPSCVINATSTTFENEVTLRSQQVPVVVDFWAPWCAPCRALGPVLEKLAQEYAGRFILVKANSDELPEAAAKFNVQGIPAVYAVVGGEVVDFFSGAIPESMVRQWLDRVLSVAALQEAKRAEAKSPAEAEQRYRALLADDPKSFEARIGLARAFFAQDRLPEAREIVSELEKRGFLEPEAQKLKASLDLRNMEGADVQKLRSTAEAHPEDSAAQYELAQAFAGAQQYEEALKVLLALVERDRKGVGEQARKLMVEIFQALPDDSDLTAQYRRKLSLALY